MRTATEQIKEKLGIVEVVQNYVKLDRAGANMKGKCPFHNEKTPSFFVSPSRNTYYCFGCGVKGDIFTFVQEFEKVDFKGALKILAERAGVMLSEWNPTDVKEKDVLYKILESATSYYEENLQKNDEVRKYLLDRGLALETIKEWRIGFALPGWNNASDHLKNKNFKESDIEKAGLIKKKSEDPSFGGPTPHRESASMYDRFRGRIMFPIFDPSSRVVGFSGRIFEVTSNALKGDKVTEAKYINSPDTVLFNKSEILYGYHKAKNVIREKKFALLVEGQLDLLMCHQIGLSQAIATSGTALTEGQLSMLKRSSSNLMIAYDGDKAGISASKRAFAIALSEGFDVKVSPMPQGYDPADLIKKDPEEFKSLLRKSLHIIDFSLEAALSKDLEGRALLKEIKEQVLPYVNATASPVERAYFVSRIAEKIKIPEDAVYEELTVLSNMPVVGQYQSSTFKSEAHSPGEKLKSKKELIERKIAGLYFGKDQEGQAVMDETFKRLFEDMPALSLELIASPYEAEREELMFNAERGDEDDPLNSKDPTRATDLEELCLALKREILKTELAIITGDLKQAEKDGNEEKAKELLKTCQELTKRLAYLKI